MTTDHCHDSSASVSPWKHEGLRRPLERVSLGTQANCIYLRPTSRNCQMNSYQETVAYESFCRGLQITLGIHVTVFFFWKELCLLTFLCKILAPQNPSIFTVLGWKENDSKTSHITQKLSWWIDCSMGKWENTVFRFHDNWRSFESYLGRFLHLDKTKGDLSHLRCGPFILYYVFYRCIRWRWGSSVVQRIVTCQINGIVKQWIQFSKPVKWQIFILLSHFIEILRQNKMQVEVTKSWGEILLWCG